MSDIYILSKDTNDEDVAEYIAGLKESVVDLESFKQLLFLILIFPQMKLKISV